MKLWAILPELILAGLCLFLVPAAGLTRRRWRDFTGTAALVGLGAAIVLTARMLPWQPVGAFHGIYAVDGFAHVFKLMILVGAFVTVALVMIYFRSHEQAAQAPVAVLFSTLGAVGLTSSLDLGLIVLFFQMMSLASYVLVALVRSDARALEATIKYFIYGAVALAVMAYGLTFLYGMTGSLHLNAIRAGVSAADEVWVALALALILVGYGFEIAAVPFHMWSPDVFSGATAPVSGFLSVVPKIAGFAALLRFLLHGLGLESLAWPSVLAIAAAVTMTFGNLAALRQHRLKRLLAYSSIAQAGYVLMSVAAAGRSAGALAAAGYYLATYLFMNLGAFAVTAQIERMTGSDSLQCFRGLGRRDPIAAAALMLSLLSLAGIPPLAGFAGKVLVLEAALDGGIGWLGILAAANMALALYYYIAVVAEMYLKSGFLQPAEGGRAYLAPYALCVFGTLALGIIPGPPLQVIELAATMLR